VAGGLFIVAGLWLRSHYELGKGPSSGRWYRQYLGVGSERSVEVSRGRWLRAVSWGGGGTSHEPHWRRSHQSRGRAPRARRSPVADRYQSMMELRRRAVHSSATAIPPKEPVWRTSPASPIYVPDPSQCLE